MAKKTIQEATAKARDEQTGVPRVQQIEQWQISKLKPYKLNAKRHPADQVEMLAKMIERHGFDQPIVVDRHGVIVKGHGRWLAAKKLKMAMVPVIVTELDAAKVIEARIADNRVAEFGWDPDKLVGDVVAGLQEGLAIEFTGYTLAELGLETPTEDTVTGDDEEQDDAVDEPAPEVEAPRELTPEQTDAIKYGLRHLRAYVRDWCKKHNEENPTNQLQIETLTVALIPKV